MVRRFLLFHASINKFVLSTFLLWCALSKHDSKRLTRQKEKNWSQLPLLPILGCLTRHLGLPWWLSGKEPTCQCRWGELIPGSGRSPGNGNGNPLQYPGRGNPMGRGAWQITVHGVAKESDTTYQWNKTFTVVTTLSKTFYESSN